MKKFKQSYLIKTNKVCSVILSDGRVFSFLDYYRGELLDTDDNYLTFLWRIDDKGLLNIDLSDGESLLFSLNKDNHFVEIEMDENKKLKKKQSFSVSISFSTKETDEALEDKKIISLLKNLTINHSLTLTGLFVIVALVLFLNTLLFDFISLSFLQVLLIALVLFFILLKAFVILSFYVVRRFFKN
jgi:hypothetical protein